jgi:hypothetical protein
MTIVIDDAGSGDLLFGVVIGAYRPETSEFKYEVIPVRFFQYPNFRRKKYLKEATEIVFKLLNTLKLESKEPVLICQGYIFDETVEALKQEIDSEIRRIKVTGELQRLAETAYLDELRNLGYSPIKEREEKRGKSFFHMLRWLKETPERLKFAKTGWPGLSKYKVPRTIQPLKKRSDETS